MISGKRNISDGCGWFPCALNDSIPQTTKQQQSISFSVISPTAMNPPNYTQLQSINLLVNAKSQTHSDSPKNFILVLVARLIHSTLLHHAHPTHDSSCTSSFPHLFTFQVNVFSQFYSRKKQFTIYQSIKIITIIYYSLNGITTCSFCPVRPSFCRGSIRLR